MVCKNFCSDLPDTAGGYGIRPYGVGAMPVIDSEAL